MALVWIYDTQVSLQAFKGDLFWASFSSCLLGIPTYLSKDDIFLISLLLLTYSLIFRVVGDCVLFLVHGDSKIISSEMAYDVQIMQEDIT